jgi:hypothetical protein
MIRILTAGALLGALLLADGTVPVAVAQRARVQRGDDISGEYVNRSNGEYCSVEARGRGFVFVNENGSRARFAYAGPRRLEMVSGDWDPDVVVTVQRDRRDRPVLRFDSGNAAPGYWEPARRR